MKTRRSGPRAAKHNKPPRRLAIETLETRRLLASLTSQLPPIVISAGSEAVHIRPNADPTKQITLPSAAVSALDELASLQQLFLDLNLSQDDGGLRASLQQDAWSRAEESLRGESFERLELEAAVEIATQGFQLVSPSPELAAERIFGPSLSESQMVSRTNDASDAGNSAPGEHAADLVPIAAGPPILAATSVEDVVADAESVAGSVADSPNTTSFAAPASRRESEIMTAGIDGVARQAASDEDDSGRGQDVGRAPKTQDMLLLPQPPTGANVAEESESDQPDAESQSGLADEGAVVVHTGEPILQQMLLLPMAPDSDVDHADSRPMLIAGFNPVAMLQIFVGADFGGMHYGESQLLDNVASGDREAEAASFTLVRPDRIAAAAFVIVVGYWYFHPAAERTLLAVVGNPATGDRGASCRMRKRLGLGRNSTI